MRSILHQQVNMGFLIFSPCLSQGGCQGLQDVFSDQSRHLGCRCDAVRHGYKQVSMQPILALSGKTSCTIMAIRKPAWRQHLVAPEEGSRSPWLSASHALAVMVLSGLEDQTLHFGAPEDCCAIMVDLLVWLISCCG